MCLSNRERLKNFVKEAQLGNHYRPMDAVGRVATLDLAERRLGPASVLGALVEEVRDLRRRVSSPPPKDQHLITIKEALGGKAARRAFLERFDQAGGTNDQWNKVLSSKIERSRIAAARDTLDVIIEVARRFGYKTAIEEESASDVTQVVSDTHQADDVPASGSNDVVSEAAPKANSLVGDLTFETTTEQSGQKPDDCDTT